MTQSRKLGTALFVFGILGVLAVAYSAASAYAANISVPLQIPISGTGSIEVCVGEKCSGIAQYVSLVYRFLVGFTAVLAVLAITWGGVRWLTSGGESGKIQEARKVIGNAIIGLVIALLSYAGLYLINPALTQFNPLTVKPIKRIDLTIFGQAELAFGAFPISGSFFMVPLSGTKDNPTIAYNGKTYTKEWFGDFWADVIGQQSSAHFIIPDTGGIGRYDATVDVHEAIHGLNSASGDRLYVGNKKYLDYPESRKVTLDMVVKRLPRVLQEGDEGKFNIYLNTKVSHKGHPRGSLAKEEINVPKQNNHSPVRGILDDFSCYNGNSKVFAEIWEKNLKGKGQSEAGCCTNGVPSFVAYSLALAKTLEEDDPRLLNGGLFKATLKALIEDGMDTYHKMERIGPEGIGETDKKMYDLLRTHADANNLRNLAKRWYNVPPHKDWTKKWLGFD